MHNRTIFTIIVDERKSSIREERATERLLFVEYVTTPE